MINSEQTNHSCISTFHEPTPKSQHTTRASPRAAVWIASEVKELTTLWDMGTFEIVRIPLNCTPLPGTWQYSVKVDD